MCSIPGLPTPGSKVPVLITRVNLNSTCGLVELWINMDNGSKRAYDQMRDEIQTPKRKFYGPEGNPGDHCLVFISDTWHRARIVSIQTEACKIFLIDQGQPHITTNEALAWGNNDSFLLPPETESCILANVLSLGNNWPEKATTFLESLPGKNFKGLVQHVLMPHRTIVLDIPTISKHMCKIGVAKKMPVDEFKCLVQKCLEADHVTQQQNLNVGCQLQKNDLYFYPELLTDHFETVNVTAVADPYHIFCKLQIFSKSVKMLSEQIQQHYEESSDPGETQLLTRGDPCAARGITGKWHRSLLKQTMTSDDAVEVFHVDEGKSESVPIGNIRPLHVKFLKMPVVTYLCSLEGLKDNGTGWNTDQTDYLTSLLLNQTFVAKFYHNSIRQDVYNVILYAHNAACINRCFIDMAGPISLSKTEPDSSVQNVPIPSTFLSPLGDKRGMELNNKVIVNVDGLLEETLPWTENQAVNGRTDDGPTSGAGDALIKRSSEHPSPLIQSNGNPLTSSPSEVHTSSGDKGMGNGYPINGHPHCTDHPLGLHSMKQEMTLQTAQQISNSSEHVSVPHEDGLLQKLINGSVLTKTTKPKQVHSSNGTCARDELKSQSMLNTEEHPEIAVPQYAVEIEHEGMANVAMHKYWKPVEDCVGIEHPHTETFLPDDQSESNMAHLSVSKGNVKTCMYKKPCISKHTEEVYASCIGGPNFFWCQYANTEELSEVSRLAREAAHAQQDTTFLESLGPGSPCLALFSSDNEWYRAKVLSRVDDEFNVVFIDYGNECNIDIKNVRSLPQSLLEKVPQAFLCSLKGFDESTGSWEDEGYDEFYNLLVDKQLRVAVINTEDHTEIAVPQYEVEIECEGMAVNAALLKYWKPVAKESVGLEPPQTETFLQDGQNESNMTPLSVSKGNVKNCMYKKPIISKNKKEAVYASCIGDPNFFWCQYANTEERGKVSRLAQEMVHTQQDTFPETLGPGSPCLALFSSDKQWYRAQVISRVEDAFNIVFIDYGNECDVDIKNVRPVPQSLLEKAPQAFLCSLNGFDKSKGSWDDEGYDEFYNLVVDKELRVTVFNTEDHPEISVPWYTVELECEGVVVNTLMEKFWKPVAKECVLIEHPQTETFLEVDQSESNMTHLSVSKGNVNTCMYKKPCIFKNKKEVYASCIGGPNFFWCQYANTEELSDVSRLAREAAQPHQDVTFLETLGPGGPCLALFSSDKQWYRAQVISRVDNDFNVVFIDYGNECDINIENVRSLPQSLLEKVPQAFLCSLNGFDESKGYWEDEGYDAFYNLVVDKELRVTVFNTEDHPEFAASRYAVEIECEGVVVNTLMEKYWKGQATDHALAKSLGSDLDPDEGPCCPTQL
ncbi:tudor domain-containing protein 6 [Etheostoma cragini]|uniref:tudor domain-containing protein 6 n=1 Tax=Etheostoma cragini TaxID=417921 RepID=UPI00155E4D52|nr:tudor domain-containing protein 6 [Etheostoma cragini]